MDDFKKNEIINDLLQSSIAIEFESGKRFQQREFEWLTKLVDLRIVRINRVSEHQKK